MGESDRALAQPDSPVACMDGMQAAMNVLEPARVLLYDGNVGFDFGATELIEYKAGGFHGR